MKIVTLYDVGDSAVYFDATSKSFVDIKIIGITVDIAELGTPITMYTTNLIRRKCDNTCEIVDEISNWLSKDDTDKPEYLKIPESEIFSSRKDFLAYVDRDKTEYKGKHDNGTTVISTNNISVLVVSTITTEDGNTKTTSKQHSGHE